MPTAVLDSRRKVYQLEPHELRQLTVVNGAVTSLKAKAMLCLWEIIARRMQFDSRSVTGVDSTGGFTAEPFMTLTEKRDLLVALRKEQDILSCKIRRLMNDITLTPANDDQEIEPEPEPICEPELPYFGDVEEMEAETARLEKMKKK